MFEFTSPNDNLNYDDQFERLEDLPAIQSLQDLLNSPDLEDETRLAAESHKWGKLFAEDSSEYLGTDLIEMCDLIRQEGLQCESHDVQTSDGYILNLFRVTHENTPSNAKAVFLQHGLFSASTTWAVRGNLSLAHVLADHGYNVWVGNNRGNIYGRRHIRLNPILNSQKFFDYSFYENGKYDTAA